MTAKRKFKRARKKKFVKGMKAYAVQMGVKSKEFDRKSDYFIREIWKIAGAEAAAKASEQTGD